MFPFPIRAAYTRKNLDNFAAAIGWVDGRQVSRSFRLYFDELDPRVTFPGGSSGPEGAFDWIYRLTGPGQAENAQRLRVFAHSPGTFDAIGLGLAGRQHFGASVDGWMAE